MRAPGQRRAGAPSIPDSGQLPPGLRLSLFAEHLRRPVLLERLPHQVLLGLRRQAADRRVAVEIGRKRVALGASGDGVVSLDCG